LATLLLVLLLRALVERVALAVPPVVILSGRQVGGLEVLEVWVVLLQSVIKLL
jgi:hypothetical protein